MKWVLSGKNNGACQFLKFLAENGNDIWAIASICDDGKNTWQDSLLDTARRLNVTCDRPRNVNDLRLVRQLAKYDPDIFLSVQYDQIISKNLLRSLDCDFVNVHFSLLPRHRGVWSLVWSILVDDDESGVTLHHLTEEIDAGDIIRQVSFRIGPEDTARDLYDRATEVSTQLLINCYPFPREVIGRRTTQNEKLASYHKASDFDFSLRSVDWTRDIRDVHRWIRAMIFPPLQYPETTLEGMPICIKRIDGTILPPVNLIPGTILFANDERIDVSGNGGCIRIIQWSLPETGQSVAKFAGKRLG